MSDLKKLFKRDRFYWGIMTVVMTLVVIHMLTNAYGLYHKLFNLEKYLERSQYLHEIWNTYPELRNPAGVLSDELPYLFLEQMVSVTVIAALIAQAVRILVQETQNRTEVLRIFPVKSRNLLTCHYLSGLLTVTIPLLIQLAVVRLDIWYVERNTEFIFSNKEQLWVYAGKAMMIFLLHYSLPMVCKKVTNHVPGTIVTFIVVELARLVLVRYFSVMDWDNLTEASIRNWVFRAATAVVLIILSYIADYKKDCARNGFYAFPIVHWVMMGIVFGEIYYIFYFSYEDIPKVLSILVALASSMMITTGVHFVMKPKKI